MRRVLVLAVLVMMVGKADGQTAEETLIRMECEIAEAQVKRDLPLLEHVIADEFLVTVSDGRACSRRRRRSAFLSLASLKSFPLY
jgi:hypothetical protein